MKISACCIIKNEEKNLPAYIDGVKDIADEIIVTDTGSTDGSLELLKKLKKKYKLNLFVHHFEWINDFAAAKNFTLQKATGDWIIFLDADEYFEEKERKYIPNILRNLDADKSIIGLDTPLLNVDVDNNYAPLSKSRQNRIFRNHKDLKFTGAIHEHLWYKGAAPIVFLQLDILIIHTGYSTSVEKQKQKRNNEIIMANKDLANDEEPTYYSYLATAYAGEKKFEEAAENFEKAINLMKKTKHFFLLATYNLYLKVKGDLKAPRKEIAKIIEDALKETDRHPDILAEKIVFIMTEKDPDLNAAEDLAKETIEKSEDKSLRSKYLNKTYAVLPYVHYVLGAILKSKGDLKNAEAEFLAALKSYRYRGDILNEILNLSEDNDKKISKMLKEYYDEKSEKDKEFLAQIFNNRPRDNLYKTYADKKKFPIDYKLASGKVTEAISLAAKEVEKAKSANLPPDEFKQNLREKFHLLTICFLFLDVKDISKVEREFDLLPQSVIALLLRYYGEALPKVDGELASYNAVKEKALIYLPKDPRKKFAELESKIP